MEVSVKELQADGPVKVWRKVHPTGGKPYVYETRAEAERMLRMCYPLLLESEARVVEVED